MENLDTVLAAIGAKLEALGPEAFAAAGRVMQLSAIGQLVCGFLIVAFGILTVWVAYALARGPQSDPGLCKVLGWVIAVTIWIISAILLHPIVWMSAFNPNIALVARVLGKL